MSKLKKAEYITLYGEKAWREEVKKRSDANKRWRVKNENWCDKEKKSAYQAVYRQTQSGRAGRLVQHYRNKDKKYNRGECTITRNWIVDKVFTSSCVYCGETDWTKLGCDRIDNNLPHTPENCVCSCYKCNIERKGKPFKDFIKKKRLENQSLF